VAAFIAVMALGLALLVSVYLIVVRFGVAPGRTRQMLWLVVGATPLPVCIVRRLLASYAKRTRSPVGRRPRIVSWLSAGFSIVKYRLYGVEQIVRPGRGHVLAT